MAGERTLPGLGLTGFWTAGSDGWGTQNDVNLRMLSALTQAFAISQITPLPGSPTNGDIYIVPAGAGAEANKIAVRDNGAWVYLTPVEGWRVWVRDEDITVVYNGTAWQREGRPVAIGTFSAEAPTTGMVLLDWLFVEPTTLFDDFAGSRASVGTNPAASFVIDVRKNGASVGTITISTGGTATFATTGGSVSFAVGDLLTLVCPTTVDAAIARLRVTFKGVV